jgi:hypothetical protein
VQVETGDITASQRIGILRQRNITAEMPKCRCKGGCFRKITVQEVVRIRMLYKSLVFGEKKMFLSSLIGVTRSRRGRAYKASYHLNIIGRQRVIVCKKFFLKVLKIGTELVNKVCKQLLERGSPVLLDGRGRHGQHKNRRVGQENAESVVDFLRQLPKYKVKYANRVNSNLEYLAASWTISKLHREFNRLRAREGRPHVSRSFMRKVMEERLPNLRIGVPKSDCCSICQTLDDRIKVEEDQQEKKRLEDEKEEHLQIADDRRSQYKKDLNKVQGRENQHQGNTVAAEANLQEEREEEREEESSDEEGKNFSKSKTI